MSVKWKAVLLIETLPDNATWDDIYYAIHVRACIEKGLEDCREGRLVSNEEVTKRFSLDNPDVRKMWKLDEPDEDE